MDEETLRVFEARENEAFMVWLKADGSTGAEASRAYREACNLHELAKQAYYRAQGESDG